MTHLRSRRVEGFGILPASAGWNCIVTHLRSRHSKSSRVATMLARLLELHRDAFEITAPRVILLAWRSANCWNCIVTHLRSRHGCLRGAVARRYGWNCIVTHLRSRRRVSFPRPSLDDALELHRDAFEITTKPNGARLTIMSALELHRDAFEITTRSG